MKRISLFIYFTFLSITSFSQNSTCYGMTSVCLTPNMSLQLNSGGAPIEVGNNYSCLSSQPNPTWLYMEITSSGDLDLLLTAPNDIDFIIYGPFNNISDAASNCGNLGNGGTGQNVIDCSYSGTNNETPSIGLNSSGVTTPATAGEVYVLLVTNYANTIQVATLSQTGGTAIVNCSSSTACISYPGTFTTTKNGMPTTNPISICENESLSIISNLDYILPSDTIPLPQGDSIYSAQLMWLVYNQPPTFVNGIMINPLTDPGFLGLNQIIPSNSISVTNNSTDTLLQNWGGCGTYYLVPVAGDDGVGGNNNIANGINDNGVVFWDTDNNGCYSFGQPLQINIACPYTVNSFVINTTCQNCSDGSISLGINDQSSTNSPFTFFWSNGDTTQFIDNLTSGSYSVTVSSNYGCTTSLNFQVTDSILPCTYAYAVTSNILNSSCNICTDGMIDLTITDTLGYYSPFTFLWSNGDTIEDIMNLTPGVYTVTLTAINGCDSTYSFEVLDGSTDGLNEISSNKNIVIYPNPNNGNFTVIIDNITNINQIIIYNSLGQVVEQIHSETLNMFTLNNYVTGVYSLRVYSNKQVYTQTFIVK